MNEKNKKHSWNIVSLILLLILPIGVSMVVGVAVTMLVYRGEAEPTVNYFMSHPWPGLLFAATVEAILAIIIYNMRSKRVFERFSKSLESGHKIRELLLGIAIGGGAISLAALVLAILGVYRPLGFGSFKGTVRGFKIETF